MQRLMTAMALAAAAAIIASVPADAKNPHWTLQSVPTPTGGGSSGLYGVACPTSTVCTAVGATSAGAFAARWNGTAWTDETTPLPTRARTGELGGVACPTTTFCMAVGYYITRSHHPLAERWNGTSWSLLNVPTPSGASGSGLAGIVCTSTSACLAVGFDYVDGTNAAIAATWNGSKWSVTTLPNPTGSNASVALGVSCPSASDCFALGSYTDASTMNEYSLAEHWNGSTWTIEPTPNPTDSAGQVEMMSVSCSAASACGAVGWYLSDTNGPQGLAMRWNGSTWAAQTFVSPTTATELFGIACKSTSVCTAVGYDTTSSGMQALAEGWSGGVWAAQSTPVPAGSTGSQLYAVRCLTTTLCTAAGSSTNGSSSVSIAERYS
jgi:hypothetical protein